MKCWHCQKELIWGGDHDIEEENEDYDSAKKAWTEVKEGKEYIYDTTINLFGNKH